LLRDLLALLFLAVASVHLTRKRESDRPRSQLRGLLSLTERHVLLSLFLLLLLWILALLAIEPGHLIGLYAARDLLLYVVVAIFAFAMFEAGYLDLRAVGDWTLGLGTVASLLGVLDSLTKGRILSLLHYNLNYSNVAGVTAPVGQGGSFFGVSRASGGVTNAVSFGYLAALVSAYALSRLLEGRGRRGRPLLALELAGFVLGGIGCVLSLTRGAALALGLCTAVIVFGAPKSRWRLLVLAGFAVIAAVVVASSSGTVFARRVTSRDAASKLSSEGRREEFKYAVHVLERHPLGVGLGSFGKAAVRYSESRAGDVTYEIEHVPLLGLAFQAGIPGAVGLLALLAVLARNGLVNVRRGGAFPLSTVIIYSVALLLGTGGEEPVSAMPLYALLALSLARPPPPRPPDTGRKRRGLRSLLPSGRSRRAGATT
jgi:hypothetical protein